MNFPGGLDPEHLRRLQEQARIAQHYYQPILERLSRDRGLQRALQESSRIYAERVRMLRGIDWQDVQRSLEVATRALRSPGFRDYMESVRRASEVAESRLGPDGLAASQRIASRKSAESTAELEQVAERIRSGQADEVLEEAAELAASPEVREEIERADKGAILRRAQEQENNDPNSLHGPILEPEAVADADVEYPTLTKKELLELHDVALRLLFVLGAALSAALLASTPLVSLPALITAVNALMLLLQWSERQINAWEDEDN